MEAIVLKNYETFDEFPNGLLVVKENSNLMYVRVGRRTFIAREFINCIEFESGYIKCIVSYFNVKNNENILTIDTKKSIREKSVEILSQLKNIDIIPLNSVLNIKQNKVTYLGLQDINNIVDFKEEFIYGKKTSII